MYATHFFIVVVTQNEVKFIGLPSNVRPERYDVNLKVSLGESKFVGHEKVTLKVCKAEPGEDDHEIVFNANGLEITNPVLELSGNRFVPTSTTFDKEKETCTLKFAAPISGAETAVLTMDFAGVLGNNLQGFYSSTYTDDEGKEHAIGVTQFEASDARRALPCWDEPAAKAVFNMTITAEAKYVILANTSAISESLSEDGAWKTVRFGDTPRMSSYLLAYVVGEFGYIEGVTKRGVKVRVYARPDKVKNGEFSLHVAGKIKQNKTKQKQIGHTFLCTRNIKIVVIIV